MRLFLFTTMMLLFVYSSAQSGIEKNNTDNLKGLEAYNKALEEYGKDSFKGAIDYFNICIAEQYKLEDVYAYKALIYNQEFNDIEKAIKVIDGGLKLFPKSNRLLFESVHYYGMVNKQDSVHKRLSKSLSYYPKDTLNGFFIKRLIQSSDSKKGIGLYVNYAELNTENATLSLNAGKTLLVKLIKLSQNLSETKGDLKNAGEIGKVLDPFVDINASRIVELKPKVKNLMLNAFILKPTDAYTVDFVKLMFDNFGDKVGSAEMQERLNWLKNPNAEGKLAFEKAIQLDTTGYYKEAIPYFEKAIKLNYNSGEALINISGTNFIHLEKKEEGLQINLDALYTYPNYIELYSNIVFMQLELEKFDEAEETIITMINLFPTSFSTYKTVASTLNTGFNSQKNRADTNYDRTIELAILINRISPFYAEGHFLYARLLQLNNEISKTYYYENNYLQKTIDELVKISKEGSIAGFKMAHLLNPKYQGYLIPLIALEKEIGNVDDAKKHQAILDELD